MHLKVLHDYHLRAETDCKLAGEMKGIYPIFVLEHKDKMADGLMGREACMEKDMWRRIRSLSALKPSASSGTPCIRTE